MASNLDIAPTLLRICGLDGEARCQGQGLLEADGRLPESGRSGLLIQHFGLHEPIAQRAFYRGGWKLIVQEDGFAELYDLETDPCELRNRAAAPEDEDRLQTLWAALRSAMIEVGDEDPRLAKILNGSDV